MPLGFCQQILDVAILSKKRWAHGPIHGMNGIFAYIWLIFIGREIYEILPWMLQHVGLQVNDSNMYFGTVAMKFPQRGLNILQTMIINHGCQGLNSHYFHIIGDGHQPNSRGLYTHYKDSY